ADGGLHKVNAAIAEGDLILADVADGGFHKVTVSIVEDECVLGDARGAEGLVDECRHCRSSISLNEPPQPQARVEPSMGWPFPGTRQLDQAMHALACTLVTLGFVAMKPTKRMSECDARRRHSCCPLWPERKFGVSAYKGSL